MKKTGFQTGTYIISSREESDSRFSFIDDKYEEAKEDAWNEYLRRAVLRTGCKIVLEKSTSEVIGAN